MASAFINQLNLRFKRSSKDPIPSLITQRSKERDKIKTATLRLRCVLGEIQLRGEWFGQLIRNYNFKLFIVWFIYTPPIFGWLSPTIADYPGQGSTHFAWFVSQTIFCCSVLSYSRCSPNRSLPSFTFGKSYSESDRNVVMGSRHWSVASYSKFYTYNWLYYFSHNLPCLHLVSLIPKFYHT